MYGCVLLTLPASTPRVLLSAGFVLSVCTRQQLSVQTNLLLQPLLTRMRGKWGEGHDAPLHYFSFTRWCFHFAFPESISRNCTKSSAPSSLLIRMADQPLRTFVSSLPVPESISRNCTKSSVSSSSLVWMAAQPLRTFRFITPCSRLDRSRLY